MAQQHQQQYVAPQRTFSPLPRTDSPHNGPHGPYGSIKRQAMSPPNHSPYGSPSMANIQLPNQVFSAPYYGGQPNGNQPYPSYNPKPNYGSPANATNNSSNPYPAQQSPSYNTNPQYNVNNFYGSGAAVNGSSNYSTTNSPQPPAPSQSGTAGRMGPPERPVDRPTDINELGDVMVGSGIDLREEEAALLNSYNKATNQQQQQSTNQVGNAWNNYGPSYMPPKENFYSSNVTGDRNSFYGGGSFNQQPAPEQSAEEIAAANKERAIRRRAEIHSYHLNNPFLSSGCVHRRLTKQAQEAHVQTPASGLLKSQPGHGRREIVLQGPDKNEVMKVVQDEDLLQEGAPLVELISLISLAAEERIRALVEDAATLAKGRRIGSHGVIPLDLTDLAAGNESSGAVPSTSKPANGASPPKANLLKRSYSEVNRTPDAPIVNGQTPAIPNSKNPVTQALQRIAKAERAAEEERLAKRQRRETSKGSGSASTGAADSIGTLGEVAPEVDVKKGSKAKDKLDASAKKALETQQHAATTKTLNMALGGKKLSWMTKGADTGPSNPFLQKPASKTDASKANAPATNGIHLPKTRVFGDFREDKETGAGIQMRDVVFVLENDGKEKKSLQRAYGRLGTQKR